RSEQDRSALVSRLLCFDFGNVPVERFQRILPLLKSADTARRVPTMCTEHLANCAQLDQPFRGQFPESSLFSHNAFCLLPFPSLLPIFSEYAIIKQEAIPSTDSKRKRYKNYA
ncbi:MAG: hypothetical protein SO054_01120, partial [Ruminococcus callidus]|nr:hypothetical protein [Ruminococcus callidus]